MSGTNSGTVCECGGYKSIAALRCQNCNSDRECDQVWAPTPEEIADAKAAIRMSKGEYVTPAMAAKDW